MNAQDDWNDGYVVDLPYTTGYYRELSPSMQQFLLLQLGYAPPHAPQEPFDYFEMGFGQGLSLNLHALSHPRGRFRGNDFNPEHVAFARGMAASSGADIHVYDDSFADLLERQLPDFDYISLHGVWSWISAANRRAIVEFLRRKLKPGGVAFVSYNALPGLASIMPLRHLLAGHERLPDGVDAPRADRIRAAVDFAGRLRDGGAHYFRINANVSNLLKVLEGKSPHYLAHEYFNRDWAPMYFSEVAGHLVEAGLSFAGSASPFGCYPEMGLSPAIQDLLNTIGPLDFREDMRDVALNTKFRRDLFVRGARRVLPEESLRLMDQLRFALVVPPEKVDSSITVGMRDFDLPEEIHQPVVDTLGGCAGAMSFRELRSHRLSGALPVDSLKRALGLLVAMECVDVLAGGELPSASRILAIEELRKIQRFQKEGQGGAQ